jgi:hypothetical protein
LPRFLTEADTQSAATHFHAGQLLAPLLYNKSAKPVQRDRRAKYARKSLSNRYHPNRPPIKTSVQAECFAKTMLEKAIGD